MEPDPEVTPVNSTARWPERLQHATTLLRAEGAAVLTVRDDGFATLFPHQSAPDPVGAGLFGAELRHAAHSANGPLTAAIAAGRWGEEVAYGIVTRIEAQATPLLCVLRHHRPFDAIEIAGAHAAAVLLAQALDDGRRVAIADRLIAVREVERAVRNGLETGGRDASILAKTAADIAASIDATGASIMVVDGQELILRGTAGASGGTVGQRRRIGEGIAGWVAQSGEPVELHGMVSDARFTGTDPRATDALVLPLRADGRVVGVLSIKRSGQNDAFDTLERTLAGEIADELARAVSADSPAGRPTHRETVSEAAPAPAPPPTGRLRVLAVEDHPVMRLGIRALLEREGMFVTGVPATCAEAVELAKASEVDVALVDLNLPDADGVDAVERLHAAMPALPIVAFTIDTSADRVRDAIRAGATGYLPKSIPTAQLVAALRAAGAGLSALTPTQAAALLEAHDAVSLVQKAVARSLPPSAEPGLAGRTTPAAPDRTAVAGPVDPPPGGGPATRSAPGSWSCSGISPRATRTRRSPGRWSSPRTPSRRASRP
ncbi:MAG: hypothetical protein NVSMB8_08600 [Candidatus Limnocylindrales bacterium]